VTGPPELTVATYNIKSATVERAALLRVLRAAAPDVLVAQEGPNHLRWRAAGARLARESGLLHLDGGRTAGTTMLFARMRVDTVRTWSRRWPTPPGDPIRGLVGGLLRFSGTVFGVVGAHYPLQPEARLRYGEQVVAAVGELRQEAALVLVCADLNEEPDGPVAQQLIAAGLMDSARLAASPAGAARPTFPVWEPKHRLDTIWCPDRTPVSWAGVPELPDVDAASDHLPWLARLTVGSA
jgi:endonuclease/exonuclease/phosphatase family metal-dependent hydrolase